MYKIECPYCGKTFEVDGEKLNLRDEEDSVVVCRVCKRQFIATTNIEITFDTHKADCLNDGNHDWQPVPTSHRAFTLMRCTMCGEEREPTPEERERYDIPSRREYFDELIREQQEIEDKRKSKG